MDKLVGDRVFRLTLLHFTKFIIIDVSIRISIAFLIFFEVVCRLPVEFLIRILTIFVKYMACVFLFFGLILLSLFSCLWNNRGDLYYTSLAIFGRTELHTFLIKRLLWALGIPLSEEKILDLLAKIVKWVNYAQKYWSSIELLGTVWRYLLLLGEIAGLGMAGRVDRMLADNPLVRAILNILAPRGDWH